MTKTTETTQTTIQDKLLESIESVQTWLEAGTDFAAEQAPFVVNEVIWRGMVVETYEAVVCLIILVCGIVGFKFFFRKAQENKWDNEGPIAGFVISCVGALIGATFFLINVIDPIVIWAAPRIYVLEQVSRLLK